MSFDFPYRSVSSVHYFTNEQEKSLLHGCRQTFQRPPLDGEEDVRDTNTTRVDYALNDVTGFGIGIDDELGDDFLEVEKTMSSEVQSQAALMGVRANEIIHARTPESTGNSIHNTHPCIPCPSLVSSENPQSSMIAMQAMYELTAL